MPGDWLIVGEDGGHIFVPLFPGKGEGDRGRFRRLQKEEADPFGGIGHKPKK